MFYWIKPVTGFKAGKQQKIEYDIIFYRHDPVLTSEFLSIRSLEKNPKFCDGFVHWVTAQLQLLYNK